MIGSSPLTTIIWNRSAKQLSRLTVKHFSQNANHGKPTRLARDFERLIIDAPAETRRRILRRAEGKSPGRHSRLEVMGDRLGRNLERLVGLTRLCCFGY